MAKKKITNEEYFKLCEKYWDKDFIFQYEYYRNIAISLFEYENLPSGLTSEIVEEMLFDNGQAIFLERKINSGDAVIGTGEYILLKCAGVGRFNLYSKPTQFNGFGLGYSVNNVSIDDCVWVRNNISCTPTDVGVMYYCRKIANLEKAIELAINTQKMPFILKVDERQNLLTLQNIFKQIECGVPAIPVNKKLDTSDVDVVNLSAPYIVDKLQIQKENVIRELQTFLGIDNIPVEKNERLIADEVSGNDVMLNDVITRQLQFRKQAVDEINTKFGLNIKVRYRNMPKSLEEREEELENGQIHSNPELPIEE